MRIAAAQATSVALLPPVDWEIRDRLREVGVLLRQPPPLRPRLHRGFEDVSGDVPAEGPRADQPSGAAVAEPAGTAAAPQPGKATGTFFWTAIAVMLAFLLGLGLIWPDLFRMAAARLP